MATVSTGSGMVLTPTSAAVATTSNYVSALTATSGDLQKRDVSEKLIKRYGDQGIMGLLELMGSKAPVSQTNYEHFEEAFIHNDMTITVTSGQTSGEDAIVATITDNYDGDAAGTFSNDTPVRVGDIVLFADGDMGWVHTAPDSSAENCKIYPVTDSTTGGGWNSTKAAGTYEMSIIGNAYPEKIGQPNSIIPRLHQYTNNVMILKESFEVSGSEATNVVYVKVDNEKMGSGYLWYLKGEADTYKRFLDYCELQLILGKKIDNSTLTALSNATIDGETPALSTLRGTEGLFDFVSNKGQSMDLGSSSITMADFDAIIKSLDKYRGAKEYAMYAGINLSLDIDDLLAAQGAYAAGGANYGTFQNSKDMALNLGFNSFSRGGYTFHKKTYDLLNHPKLTAMSGSNYPGWGICIPMDMQKDAKSGSKIPSLRMRYKAANGYSREMEHWLTGSAILQNKTETQDRLKSHYRTERGFEGFAANRYMLIKKS